MLQHIATDPEALPLIDYISKRMNIVLSSPEEIMFKEGETIAQNDSIYFIASGECIVEQKEILSSKGNISKIAVLSPG